MDFESKETKKSTRFMTIFPQILACLAKNMIIIDFGLGLAMPTVIIPVLRGLQIERNPNETLLFSDEVISWLGSVPFISQPIGCVLSGWFSEPIGRKRAMILFNIPHFIGWALLAYANSAEMVFIAIAMMGFGVGLMEAPIITYVGEICQPNVRGLISAGTGIALMFGNFFVFLLGSITTWRYAALICLPWPILTMLAISFVPESPNWLMSVKREAEALRSLQWLRGWVTPKEVESEFNDLKRYSEASNSCVACYKADIKCSHPPAGLPEKFKELLRKRTMRPLLVVLFCFAIIALSGMLSMRSYMVQIVKAYEIPIDANWVTVVVAVVQILGNIICMCFIKVLGKRRLYFISLTGAALSCFGLGFYAMYVLPAGLSSFDKHEISQLTNKPNNYSALMMLMSLPFFTAIGVAPIPFMVISEVFPFKTRSIISGLAVAVCGIFVFVAVKTYTNLETTFRLSGTMFFFGSMNVICLCGILFLLPETEGRSLEEIELYFSDNRRSVLDRQIKKSVKEKECITEICKINV